MANPIFRDPRINPASEGGSPAASAVAIGQSIAAAAAARGGDIFKAATEAANAAGIAAANEKIIDSGGRPPPMPKPSSADAGYIAKMAEWRALRKARVDAGLSDIKSKYAIVKEKMLNDRSQHWQDAPIKEFDAFSQGLADGFQDPEAAAIIVQAIGGYRRQLDFDVAAEIEARAREARTLETVDRISGIVESTDFVNMAANSSDIKERIDISPKMAMKLRAGVRKQGEANIPLFVGTRVSAGQELADIIKDSRVLNTMRDGGEVIPADILDERIKDAWWRASVRLSFENDMAAQSHLLLDDDPNTNPDADFVLRKKNLKLTAHEIYKEQAKVAAEVGVDTLAFNDHVASLDNGRTTLMAQNLQVAENLKKEAKSEEIKATVEAVNTTSAALMSGDARALPRENAVGFLSIVGNSDYSEDVQTKAWFNYFSSDPRYKQIASANMGDGSDAAWGMAEEKVLAALPNEVGGINFPAPMKKGVAAQIVESLQNDIIKGNEPKNKPGYVSVEAREMAIVGKGATPDSQVTAMAEIQGYNGRFAADDTRRLIDIAANEDLPQPVRDMAKQKAVESGSTGDPLKDNFLQAVGTFNLDEVPNFDGKGGVKRIYGEYLTRDDIADNPAMAMVLATFDKRARDEVGVKNILNEVEQNARDQTMQADMLANGFVKDAAEPLGVRFPLVPGVSNDARYLTAEKGSPYFGVATIYVPLQTKDGIVTKEASAAEVHTLRESGLGDALIWEWTGVQGSRNLYRIVHRKTRLPFEFDNGVQPIIASRTSGGFMRANYTTGIYGGELPQVGAGGIIPPTAAP